MVSPLRAKPKKEYFLIALVAIVLLLIVYVIKIATGGKEIASSKSYFTTDDGQTVFVDAGDRLPPFDHHGKPAVRAWMFSADEGKTKFVGYLERYTPEGKMQLESQLADFKAGKTHVPPGSRNFTEVKKAGAVVWVNSADPRAAQVMNITSPNGSTVDVQMP